MRDGTTTTTTTAAKRVCSKQWELIRDAPLSIEHKPHTPAIKTHARSAIEHQAQNKEIKEYKSIRVFRVVSTRFVNSKGDAKTKHRLVSHSPITKPPMFQIRHSQ